MRDLDITPNKVVIGFIIIILLFLGYEYLSFVSGFSGNSYSNTEKYVVSLPYNDLKNRINTFKEENPQYFLITSNEKGEDIVYEDDEDERYYYIFFYYKDIDLTIQCLLEPKNEGNSLLSLYAVSKGVNFASWKLINTDDLTKKENKELKNKFETEILDKLGKWKHKRWYN